MLERQTNPEKFWKHNDADWRTNKLFEQYHKVYEDVFANCNQPEWIVVPTDQNWYKEYIVAKTIVEKLEELNMSYPKGEVNIEEQEVQDLIQKVEKNS